MTSAFFLALEEDGWRVARIEGDEVHLSDLPAEGLEAATAAAEQAAEALRASGYNGAPVCLGLPSGLVMVAAVDATNLPRRGRRTAMIYRAEEQLPLEAEGLTADFLPAIGGRALGLAVETRRVRALLDRLVEAGVEVTSICPTSLLAVQRATGREGETCDYLLVATSGGVDVCRMTGGTVVGWFSASAEAGDLVRAVQADLLIRPAEDEDLRAGLLGPLPDGVADRFQRETGVRLEPLADGPAIALAAREAVAIAQGDRAAWVDFRRDNLAAPNAWRRLAGPLRLAVALGLALLVTLSALFFWRGTRYETLATRFEEDARNVYMTLCPNQAVPVNVRSRLKSETARLAGLSGAIGGVPRQPSALETFRQLVVGLPRDLRFRLVEVRIDSSGLLLEGEARSHGDAETVARTLSRSGALQMDSPRSESLAKGGVVFTLVGKLADQQPPAKGGGPGP